jgi:hypothetical protein
MQAQGHARGVPMVKRTRTCAVPEGRHGAGLRGFQLGCLAKQAAMRRLILRSHRVRSLRAHLGCLAALQVLEVPASPPHGGVFSGSQDRPGCGCRCPRAPSVYRVNGATRATVVGRQPIKSAAMSLWGRFSLRLGRPRKWADGSACPLRESFTSEADHGRGHARGKI